MCTLGIEYMLSELPRTWLFSSPDVDREYATKMWNAIPWQELTSTDASSQRVRHPATAANVVLLRERYGGVGLRTDLARVKVRGPHSVVYYFRREFDREAV